MAYSSAATVDEYLQSLPPDRAEAVQAVRKIVLENLPDGYVETMQHGMIAYAIPLERYPDTYNKLPARSNLPCVAEAASVALSACAVYGRGGGGAFSGGMEVARVQVGHGEVVHTLSAR
ncbi:MAG: hypothetical protein OXT69_01870 [Candidatus Poribacteria bacterium]|nr:hypothetical protein [Candidatus Poribacteria bacterium]